MDNGFSKYFLRNTGIKKGDHSVLHSLLDASIKLDEIVNMFMKQGLDGPKLVQELNILLFCAYEVLFPYILDAMQFFIFV